MTEVVALASFGAILLSLGWVTLGGLHLPPTPVNIIDGTDDRGALVELGPKLGLSIAEITRIRSVSGHVACLKPVPKVGSGALFVTNGQILTAAHMFFDGAARQSPCFFRAQAPGAAWVPLLTDSAHARFGAEAPKPGSNNDWAIVQLSTPLSGAIPFPVDPGAPATGDRLIVVSAHPQGFDTLDPSMPVVQGCAVRRAPKSTAATTFYRTDCDASPGSSGGMHLFRQPDGKLVFRGMTISTGPVEDEALHGAPYSEKVGSVTTALGTNAAILAAGSALAGQ